MAEPVPILPLTLSLSLSLSPVTDLLYWEDVKKTGSVFGAIILVMFSLTQFSSISVLAYLTLSILSVTISLRVYTSVLHLVYKTQERHPFQVYLDMDITLSQEQLRKYTETLLLYITSSINHLRRLFLVQHLLESLKVIGLLFYSVPIENWRGDQEMLFLPGELLRSGTRCLK
uniref:Reticulon n=1 Tax=Callorhinchus milii TaxID=7868 RepID=A0A4W3GX37_CALMI